MKLIHLFKEVFDLERSLLYKKGADVPKGNETVQLSPSEMQKELQSLARQHVEAANTVAREAESYLARIEPSAKELAKKEPSAAVMKYREMEALLQKVNQNIATLEQAIKAGKVSNDLLRQSRDLMLTNVGGNNGLQAKIKREFDVRDPMEGITMNSYSEYSYATDIRHPGEALAKAEADVFRAIRNLAKYAPAGPNSARLSGNRQYDRELTELAMARQLLRKRGELPIEKDVNLNRGRELFDISRLIDAAEAGRYVQETPQALLRSQEQAIRALLAGKTLKAGEALKLGQVAIQRAKKGEAYLLTVAEADTSDNENPIAHNLTCIIDLGYPKEVAGLELQIKTERAKAQRGDAKAEARVAILEDRYDALRVADYDDFPSNAEAISDNVAIALYNSRFLQPGEEAHALRSEVEDKRYMPETI